jgi:hypothetical protein
MFCGECGQAFEEQAGFCGGCGVARPEPAEITPKQTILEPTTVEKVSTFGVASPESKGTVDTSAEDPVLDNQMHGQGDEVAKSDLLTDAKAKKLKAKEEAKAKKTEVKLRKEEAKAAKKEETRVKKAEAEAKKAETKAKKAEAKAKAKTESKGAVATSNISKYHVGQRVEGLEGGTVSGWIAEITPKKKNASSGSGLLKIHQECPLETSNQHSSPDSGPELLYVKDVHEPEMQQDLEQTTSQGNAHQHESGGGERQNLRKPNPLAEPLLDGNGYQSDGSDNNLSDEEPLPAIITICDNEDRTRREVDEKTRSEEDEEQARREEMPHETGGIRRRATNLFSRVSRFFVGTDDRPKNESLLEGEERLQFGGSVLDFVRGDNGSVAYKQEEETSFEARLEARLESQRMLLQSQRQQDKESSWLMTKFRENLLRPGDVGEKKLTFLQYLGLLFSVYNMFTCLWQATVMYGRNSDCCDYDNIHHRNRYGDVDDDFPDGIPEPTQWAPPRDLNCRIGVADFYGIALMIFRLYGILAFIFVFPSILMYLTLQKLDCDADHKQLLRREFKLTASFVGWASSLPLVWINGVMLTYVQHSSSPVSTLLAKSQLGFSVAMFLFNTYAFFFTPVWDFIRHNLELRARLVLTTVPALIMFPLALSYYLGRYGGGAGDALIIVPSLLAILAAAVITRLLNFATPRLADWNLCTVVCRSVFLVLFNTGYFLVQQTNRRGTQMFDIPPVAIAANVLFIECQFEWNYSLDIGAGDAEIGLRRGHDSDPGFDCSSIGIRTWHNPPTNLGTCSGCLGWMYVTTTWLMKHCFRSSGRLHTVKVFVLFLIVAMIFCFTTALGMGREDTDNFMRCNYPFPFTNDTYTCQMPPVPMLCGVNLPTTLCETPEKCSRTAAPTSAPTAPTSAPTPTP